MGFANPGDMDVSIVRLCRAPSSMLRPVDRVVNLRDEKLSLFKCVPAPIVTFLCPSISLHDIMLDHVYISSAFCLFASY